MRSIIERGVFRFPQRFTAITHSFHSNLFPINSGPFSASFVRNTPEIGLFSLGSTEKIAVRPFCNPGRRLNSSGIFSHSARPFTSLGSISTRQFTSSTTPKDLDENTETMAEIPTWTHPFFRYKEYTELELFSLTKMTNGASGHLFNDTLAKNPDYSMRMFLNTTEALLEPSEASNDAAHFTTETLSGDDVMKLLLNGELRKTKTQLIAVVNVGKECCGHPGVWHGGVISAIMDNLFGLIGNIILPVAATKSLNIQFRAPILVGSTVVAVTEFDPQGDLGGRFTAHGSIFDKNGKEAVKGSSELVDVSGKWKK